MSGYADELKKRNVRPVVNWWRDRWRKKIGRDTKYFAFPNSRDGYERACAAYYRLKDEAKPHGREYLYDIEQTQALADFHGADVSRHRAGPASRRRSRGLGQHHGGAGGSRSAAAAQ